MKRQGPDPIVYVFIGLLVLALLSVYAVFAGRSCAKQIIEGAKSGGEQPYTESGEFKRAAAEVSQEEYGTFAKAVEGIDFGIGVRVGMRKDELRKQLGDPESVSRASGGKQILSYMLPPGAKGPRPEERRQGGFFDTMRMAVLAVTLRDGIAEEVLFTISPMSKEGDRWEFIRLGSKPLAECVGDDFKALLGEPTRTQHTTFAWHYAPADAPLGARQSVYIHAVFGRAGGKLSELYIVKNG